MSIGDNGSGQLPDKQLVSKGRWKPGQSGNPKGRPPKAISITSLVKEILDEVPEEVKPGVKNTEGKTWAELVAVTLVRGAVEGNSAHLKELLERMEGKVTQPIRAELAPETKDYLARLSESRLRLKEAEIIEAEYKELPEPNTGE